MDPLEELITSPFWGTLLVVVAIWTVVWKGVALYTAGKNQQKAWFIFLLLLNDLGILSMVYLKWFQKRARF
jgi:hypothetical protein